MNNNNNKTILYQLHTQTPQQMMSYVIVTKDNKCIVIDGGNVGDSEFLLNFLIKKTGMQKPIINGWFFTHIHSDHTNSFITLANKKSDSFTVEKLYYNFPKRDIIGAYDYSRDTVSTLDSFYAAIKNLDTKSQILQTGENVQVGDIDIDVLLVQDDSNDTMKNSNVVNNSSLILRFSIEDQTILFLGDCGREQGSVLLSMYGDKLKSDMVQMAHHGQNGVDENVYIAIAPKVCLWPTPHWLYENNPGQGYNTGPWQTVIVREWIEKLDVTHHFIDKDGLATIELPFEF